MADALKAIRATGSRAQLLTLPNNASGGFIKLLGENARGTIITQVFPNERSIASLFVKEAIALAKVQNVTELSPATLERFAAAKVLVEHLRCVERHARLRHWRHGRERFNTRLHGA